MPRRTPSRRHSSSRHIRTRPVDIDRDLGQALEMVLVPDLY